MGKNTHIYTARRSARPRKRKNRLAWGVGAFILLIGFVAAEISTARQDSATTHIKEIDIAKLLLVAIPDETPEINKDYTGFSVSFNPAHHLPNYVAWELTAAKSEGDVPRVNKFRADTDVYGCPTLDDYRNSGFDRGHMAPAGDMKWDRQAMLDSHYLTNICPQTHQLNGGRWSTLETKCRQWALRDSVLIIIAGPILSDELPRAIGRMQVSVPERFFKVVLAPFAEPPRAIGFIMPNSVNIDGLEDLTVPVDRVEQITGFDFFSALPDSIENQIERQSNFRDWNRRKR